MVLCGLIGSPRAAHAAVGDVGTLEDGTYIISSVWASSQGYSRCWDVAGGDKDDGTKVQSWQNNATGNQRWRITTDSDGYSTIVNAQSGKALDVPGCSIDWLEQLWIWHSIDYDAQKWKITEDENGYKIASALNESYVIDLAYWSTDNGAMLILTGDSGNANQRWTFERCTEDALNISDEQTEMFDTSVYLTDFNRNSLPVIESVTDGWSVKTNWVDGYSAHYTAGEYWTSYGAVIRGRWDKIGKVNGQWVSLRYTFSSLRGDGASPLTGDSQIAFLTSGCFQYSGLRQCDLTMELFYTDTKQTIPLNGAFCGFSSLDASSGLTFEGVGYLTSTDYKAYIRTTNNLKRGADGIWWGRINNPDTDNQGSKNYTKSAISFGVVDATPKFRFANEDSLVSSFVGFSLSPLTAAIPPSPTKSATITS